MGYIGVAVALLLAALALPAAAPAQAVITLKDGTVIRGNVVVTPGVNVTDVEIAGQRVLIPSDQILRIQVTEPAPERPAAEPAVPEKPADVQAELLQRLTEGLQALIQAANKMEQRLVEVKDEIRNLGLSPRQVESPDPGNLRRSTIEFSTERPYSLGGP